MCGCMCEQGSEWGRNDSEARESEVLGMEVFGRGEWCEIVCEMFCGFVGNGRGGGTAEGRTVVCVYIVCEVRELRDG